MEVEQWNAHFLRVFRTFFDDVQKEMCVEKRKVELEKKAHDWDCEVCVGCGGDTDCGVFCLSKWVSEDVGEVAQPKTSRQSNKMTGESTSMSEGVVVNGFFGVAGVRTGLEVHVKFLFGWTRNAPGGRTRALEQYRPHRSTMQ